MKTAAILLISGMTWFCGGHARAEVRQVAENAFTIETTVLTNASPAEAYRALGNVAAWWDPGHTYSGSSKNLGLQMQAGGCFCETLPSGGSVEHGRVINVQPGVLLRLDTALGPLQDMAVAGVLSFALAPDGPGTRITMTYRVSGAMTLEAGKLAPMVDGVLGGQLSRLKAYGDSLKPAK